MYWRLTINIGKLFCCVRIRYIDAQLEILESFLAALGIDAQLDSYLAALVSDVLTLN